MFANENGFKVKLTLANLKWSSLKKKNDEVPKIVFSLTELANC